MPAFLLKRNRLLATVGPLVMLPLLFQTWWLTAGPRGQLSADFDLWRGHYAIHTYGLNLASREFTRILKERYGVETHTEALCLVSKSQIACADAYNRLSTAAANRKFGHDIFKECSEEARQEWESHRAQMQNRESK